MTGNRVVALIGLFIAQQAQGQTADINATIDRAVAAWDRVHTVRSTFEQSIVNPVTGSTMTAKGALLQEKPDKLAITFSDPAGDRIVADGKFVWVYLQSATPGQVIKLTNAAAGASNTDLLGQFITTPRSAYDVTDAGRDDVLGRPARALLLVARQGQTLPFIRAKVWVDSADALIRQFESTDATGITRKVKILSLATNVAVDAKAFAFVLPAGVRVIAP